MKKILMLIVLCGIALWAKGPATARFCVRDISDDGSFFSFNLYLQGNVLPDKKWNFPDSLPCGSLRWKNKLSFEYGGTKFNLEGNESDLSERFSCKLCSDDKRLLKKPTFKSRIENLRFSYSYSQEKNSIDKEFLESLYGKTVKATWDGAYSCYCPEYETPRWTATLNLIVEGECPSSMTVMATEAFNEELQTEGGVAEGNCSDESFDDDTGGIGKDVFVWSNLPKGPGDPVPAEGLFACYSHFNSMFHHPVNAYASFKPMIMVDEARGLEESLECFEIKGERFLVFGTNVPGMSYSTGVPDEYGYDYRCFVSKGDFDKMEEVETPFYTCGKNKTDFTGCKAVPHGVDIVVNMDMTYEGWDRNDLWFYVKLMESEDIKSFVDYIRYDHWEKLSLPQNVTESVLRNIGDEAAQKTAGMWFYKGCKRVKYEKYDRNHLKSLKEAVESCKVFGF